MIPSMRPPAVFLRSVRVARLLALALAGGAAAAAVAFDGELALVPESLRERTREALVQAGRDAEAEVLAAMWRDDSEAFVEAARNCLRQSWDRRLAALLASRLDAVGRSDEADAVRAEMRARRPLRAARTDVGAGASYDLSGRRPVVFLHGYYGDRSTWSDFRRLFLAAGYGADDLLVFSFYSDSDDETGAARGLVALDASVDTRIERIAQKVAANTRVWLRRRAGFEDDDASHDAELPAADFVCHSMGGLVFRRLYADRPELAHRCVDLGTPHFGQNVALSIAGDQTKQMKYGSSFLWELAADWCFRGRDCKDMIFIVGAGENNSEVDSEVVWDGLVCAFSATMLTLADADYARRTFFVNRIHSSVMDVLYSHPGLTELSDRGDPVFRLAYGYLNDGEYFADGAVPAWGTVLSDDGADASRVENVIRKCTSYGGLFVQAVHPATNTLDAVASPVVYGQGMTYRDDIVQYLKSTSATYKSSTKRCYWEHGADDDGYKKGLVQIYGNIPADDYDMKITAPEKDAPRYTYPYHENVTIWGGGTRVMRTRPGGAEPMSRFTLTDDTGANFDVTVPNSWFAAQGMAAGAEDIEGCLAAGTNVWANGRSGAESRLLGLTPNDPDSQLAIASIAVDADAAEVGLRLRSGGSELLAEDRAWGSPSGIGMVAVVVQEKPSPDASWRDVTGLRWQRGDGWWRVPSAAGGRAFYRVVVRPR